MRIGIDIRCLTEAQYSGISQYTYNLLQHLFTRQDGHQYILFYNSARAVRVPDFSFPNVTVRKFQFPNKLFNLGIRFLKVTALDELIGGVDIFLSPNFLFSNFSPRCNLVLIVHDLSFELYPEFFTFKKRLWHQLIDPSGLCRRADRIVAISENTRRDIASNYQINDEKMAVIPPGVNDAFFAPITEAERQRVQAKYLLPEKYLFYLGNLEPRKNIETLLEAVTKLEHPISLVIAGGQAWKYRRIYGQARALLDQERVKFLGYVDEADKPALYAQATSFIYPSVYEGFGLPPLEAMACGTPVITSNSSSLPEAVGDAAVMVDPYDVNALVAAIEQVCGDESLANDLRERGRVRAEQFRWDTTAAAFAELFSTIKPK